MGSREGNKEEEQGRRKIQFSVIKRDLML